MLKIPHCRNLSQGSPDTGFYGSMEKEKRRKKLDDGRIAPEDVINELMEGVDLKQDVNHDEAESKYINGVFFSGKCFSILTKPILL